MQTNETLVSRLLYSGFWEGKLPCWKMLWCPRAIKELCPAFRHPELPCWEIEGTYAKLTKSEDGMIAGCNTEVCLVCRVYRRWGRNQPMDIRLFGQGINNCPSALENMKKILEVD